MTYRTRYAHVNTIEIRQAWIMALKLDGRQNSFSKAIAAPTEETVSRADLEQALVSMARRVAELEHEWS